MPETEHRLQVLIANERDDRLDSITAIVESLGHEIVGRDKDIGAIGALSRSTGAEVALVRLGLDGAHALEQISEIVREAACPVIALLDVADKGYVEEAAKRGVFATSSWTTMTPPRSRALSTSRCGGSPSSRTCKERSDAAPSSSRPKASSWSETASTPTPPSPC